VKARGLIMQLCVCVCECERESALVYVTWVCMWESLCVCVCASYARKNSL